MWYGLFENSELVAVKRFNFEPKPRDFGVILGPKREYSVAVVRIRAVGSMLFY